MSRHYLNYLLLFLLVMFWGGSYIAIKYTVMEWPPFFSAGFRILVSLVTLYLLIITMGKNVHIEFHLRWRVWTLGIFALGLPLSALFWGERFISAGLAGILNATTLIWTFLISLMVFSGKEFFCLKKLSGIIIGFIGILIIFWKMLRFNGSESELFGALAVLMMAVSYGIAGVFAQKLFSKFGKLDLYTNLYHQCWSGFLFCALLSVLFEKTPSWHAFSISYAAILSTLYLGIFSTAIGWMIYYYLIHAWGAIRASIASYLIPIAALLDDYIFFHHVPVLNELIGAFVILASMALIQSAMKIK